MHAPALGFSLPGAPELKFCPEPEYADHLPGCENDDMTAPQPIPLTLSEHFSSPESAILCINVF